MSTQQSDARREFLLQLASLCDRYNATFHTTSDDDGIHIAIDGSDVLVDFLDEQAGDRLRAAASL